MTPAIEFRGVSKRYTKLEQQPMLVRSLLTLGRDRKNHLWALRDVDLTVEHGDVVGVLGRNGAGKSTMLRLMAGVTQPSEGEVRISGRVAPLISVGVGFYPEMSGRENIYVNGMLLGLTKEQISDRFDDIVDFAELHDFIDTPVKFYSSGMFMRLGFAVAVHTDPSVFLIDEVLAVGDIAFQLKCFERMRQIREAGTTLVVVSHNVQAVRILCPRVLVMAHGVVVYDGDAESAIGVHHELLEAEARDGSGPRKPGEVRHVKGVSVVQRALEGPVGQARIVTPGAPLTLRLRLAFDRPIVDPGYRVMIHDESGTLVYATQTPVSVSHRTFAAGEESEIELRFVAQLEGGTYRMDFAVTSADGATLYCRESPCAQFFVDPGSWTHGIAKLDGTFLVDGRPFVDERNHRLDSPSQTVSKG